MGKAVKKIKKATGDVLEGAVKGVSGAAEVLVTNPIRFAANATSGVLTGNTDKVKNSVLRYGQDQFQSGKSIASGALQAGTGSATVGSGGLMSVSSKGNFLGDTRTSGQVRAAEKAAAEKAELDKLDAEEAARPEKERQAFFNKQYENSLLRNKGRGYNSLLGGGY